MVANDNHFPFLSLPGELRELIYKKALLPVENQRDIGDGYKDYKYDLAILRVNQQIYHEARKVFRDKNVFVSVSTPWVEAQQHVQMEGFVPILAAGRKARAFKHWHLSIKIDAPGHEIADSDFQHFLILLDDLGRFCDMWFYSDLTHPGLNPYLRLTLTLQDPYSLSFDPRPVPKLMQKRLLEPFGAVKRLSEVVVKGEHYGSIEKAMRDAMALPYKSPDECLEEASRLKDEGDAALQAKRYQTAVELYEKAFLAIHIVCEGRRRSIFAETFFQTGLHSDKYRGKYGHVVRLVLRVQLVASVVNAYLGLEDYEEARFWGERSINIMREAMGGRDGPIRDFFITREMGYIYSGTGKACRALGRYEDAKQYFTVAMGYLPEEKEQIDKELNDCHSQRTESA